MHKRIKLLNDEGIICDAFSVGETVFVSGQGLPPLASLTFSLEGKKMEVLAQLSSDRHGAVPITVLMPYFGLVRHQGEYRFSTHVEAEEKLCGQQHAIRINGHDQQSFEERVSFHVQRNSRPHLFPSDHHGQLLTGVERGETEIGLTLRNFPEGCVRIVTVPRQFGWRVGDPIEPARNRAGRPLIETVRLNGSESHSVALGTAEEVGVGHYQFIARPF